MKIRELRICGSRLPSGLENSSLLGHERIAARDTLSRALAPTGRRDPAPVAAVGREFPVKAGQVRTRRRNYRKSNTRCSGEPNSSTPFSWKFIGKADPDRRTTGGRECKDARIYSVYLSPPPTAKKMGYHEQFMAGTVGDILVLSGDWVVKGCWVPSRCAFSATPNSSVPSATVFSKAITAFWAGSTLAFTTTPRERR